MKRNLVKLCLFVSLAGVLLLSACSKNQPAKTAEAKSVPDPLTVAVRQMQLRKTDKTIQVTGSLYPDEAVVVSAEVAGRVDKIYADFGAAVRQGQVLAELDKRELTWQLERARASLAQALARVGLRPGEDKVPEETPAVRQAAAQLADAQFKYENAKKLVKTGDIAEDRFRELETLYLSRKAAYDAARDELRVQQALIEALKAEVALAEKRLNDATIRAPFDGAITEKLISPGQYVRDNVPLFRMVKTAPLRLRLEVPESAAPALKAGNKVQFRTDAAPGETFEAVVQRVSPSLDAQSRSLAAEARLLSADPRLKPGMFVQVEVVTERDAETLVAPREAVYSIAGLNKIFTVREGKVKEHKVTLGRQWDGWVEVFGPGLAAGEPIALDNLPQLVDGLAVNVKEARS